MTAGVWRRFGPEGHWSTDLGDADRRALLGVSHVGVTESSEPSAPEGVKVCRTCGTAKSLEEFGRKSSAKDGRQSHCRPCRRVVDPGAEPVEVLDESNSRICRSCYTQVHRRLFAADPSRASGLSLHCTPCTERKGL